MNKLIIYSIVVAVIINLVLPKLVMPFATEEETKEMSRKFEEGIAWGAAKQELFEYINGQVKDFRDEYNKLLDNPDYVQKILMQGADKAREVSMPYIKELRDAIGFTKIEKL